MDYNFENANYNGTYEFLCFEKLKKKKELLFRNRDRTNVITEYKRTRFSKVPRKLKTEEMEGRKPKYGAKCKI